MSVGLSHSRPARVQFSCETCSTNGDNPGANSGGQADGASTAPTEGQMAKRKIFWVLVIAAILGAVVAVTARSSRAEAAVDDCLSKPNAPPPQGSHWYYRSDRASNRRCWYLGPQGEKISQAASPRQRP